MVVIFVHKTAGLEKYLRVFIVVFRGKGMCELWRDFHSPLAARRHRALLVQRLRTLPQNERTKQTFNQAQETFGEYYPLVFPSTKFIHFQSLHVEFFSNILL